MMLSSDVSPSDPIEAQQYNNLRADVIANSSAIADLEAEMDEKLDTHIATAASVHGLPAGVSVLGTKQGAGLRIEYAVATATWTHTGGQWETHSAGVSFANPFSSILAIVDSHVVRSVSDTAYAGEDRGIKYSLTAATKTLRIYNSQGEKTSMEVGLLIIGT